MNAVNNTFQTCSNAPIAERSKSSTFAEVPADWAQLAHTATSHTLGKFPQWQLLDRVTELFSPAAHIPEEFQPDVSGILALPTDAAFFDKAAPLVVNASVVDIAAISSSLVIPTSPRIPS